LKLLVDTVSGTGKPPSWIASSGLLGADSARNAGLLIFIAAFGALLCYGVGSLVDAVLSYGWMKTGQRLVYDVAGDLYAKLQQRSLVHHNEKSLGDSLTRLFGDSLARFTISYALLTVPLQHLMTIFVIGIVAWRIDATLTLIALGVVPAATVFSYILAGKLRRLARDEARLTSEIMAFVQQT